MRIALVVPDYPPEAAGGGAVAYSSLADQYAKPHAVRIFAGHDADRKGHRPFIYVHGGSEVFAYPLMRVPRKAYLRSVPPPNGRSLLRLWRDLTAWAPDVGHLHGYGHAFVDLAARWFRRSSIPYVFSVHGIPLTPHSRGVLLRQAYQAYERLGPKRTIRGARSVTAVSRDICARLPGAVLVPNGITPLPVSDPEQVRVVLDRCGINPSTPLILGAGRLSRAKGFDVLLKALSHIDNPLTCVIAGEDWGELAELRALGGVAPEWIQVKLPGALTRAELGALMQAASVVVIPSRDEPFGLVAIEALAAHKRVVATKTGGLVDFLQDDLADFVPVDDEAALAQAIKGAIAKGPLTDTEKAQADAVIGRYSWSEISLRYAEILARAMKG